MVLRAFNVKPNLIVIDAMHIQPALINLAEDMEQAIRDFFRQLIIELYGRIVFKTPVLEGWLRGSWTVGVGRKLSRSQTNCGLIDTVSVPMLPKEIQMVNSRLDKIKHKLKIVHISNSMEYAPKIEYTGYSKRKAPAGMATVSVAEVIAWAATQ